MRSRLFPEQLERFSFVRWSVRFPSCSTAQYSDSSCFRLQRVRDGCLTPKNPLPVRAVLDQRSKIVPGSNFHRHFHSPLHCAQRLGVRRASTAVQHAAMLAARPHHLKLGLIVFMCNDSLYSNELCTNYHALYVISATNQKGRPRIFGKNVRQP